MAKNSNTGKIIFGLSLVALAVGGFFLLKPKKIVNEDIGEKEPESKTSTESNNIQPPPTLPSTNPTGTTTTNSVPTKPDTTSPTSVSVYSTANGAIVYKANMKADGSATVGAKVRNAQKGEKVGKFVGNRDISGYTFLLAKDSNSGQPVLISKSVSKTAL